MIFASADTREEVACIMQFACVAADCEAFRYGTFSDSFVKLSSLRLVGFAEAWLHITQLPHTPGKWGCVSVCVCVCVLVLSMQLSFLALHA